MRKKFQLETLFTHASISLAFLYILDCILCIKNSQTVSPNQALNTVLIITTFRKKYAGR